jgi:hypothetical protein
MELSESVGLGYYSDDRTNFNVLYGVTGPTTNQNNELILDYDGGLVFKETTITLFKGSLKYGQGDKSTFDNGNITIVDLYSGLTSKVSKIVGEIAPFQNPDKLYNSEFQLNNLAGIHEVDHTTSSNIKTANYGGDAEKEPMRKEEKSREDPNFKK